MEENRERIDTISREEVLDVLWHSSFRDDYEYKICKEKINNLPVVNSNHYGHWIQIDYQRGKFECSECHTQGYVDTCMYEPKWNFCPNCGARMERKNENE